MGTSTTTLIGLGSNLGDGIVILKRAWQRLGEDASVSLSCLSHPYVSKPLGMESRNWFTNAVGALQTTLSAHQLLELLLAVESEFGRKRDLQNIGYQDRSLDLDILYFGTTAVNAPALTIPHPHIGKRLFVLTPLAEIAPGFYDHLDGVTVEKKRESLFERIRTGLEEPQEITKVSWDVVPSAKHDNTESALAHRQGG